MSDLVAILRMMAAQTIGVPLTPIEEAALKAADRIAALEAENARLRAALVDHNDLLRSSNEIAKREGIAGRVASTNWDAFYNRVAVALKRHHETTNAARAAEREGGEPS